MESQNVRIGVVKNELSEEDCLQQRHITATSEIKMCTVVPTESCIYLCLFKKNTILKMWKKPPYFLLYGTVKAVLKISSSL